MTLGLVAAAGFESSTWVGGVTFAAAALAVGVMLLAMAGPGQRRPFAIGIAMAAVLAACLAAPFILDQVIATAARDGGSPIALQPTAVLGEFLPEGWRRLLDLPAFWLIYLPVEFPAVYPLGVIALAILLGSRRLDAERSQVTLVLAVLAAASLVVSWLFASRIGYNDLGWRAAIPGLMVLTIMSAVILARWITGRVIVPVGLACCFWRSASTRASSICARMRPAPPRPRDASSPGPPNSGRRCAGIRLPWSGSPTIRCFSTV